LEAAAAAYRYRYRGAHVRPESPGGEDEGEAQADGQEGRCGRPRRELRREGLQRGAGAGDDQHREQRLELVADAVEADAEARIGPEQRERGERGAGDHVDRVGEHDKGGRHRERPVAAGDGERDRRAGRGADQDEEPFGALAGLERRAGEEDERQVDDAEAGEPDAGASRATAA